MRVCFGFISIMGFILSPPLCPIAFIISCILAVGSFWSATRQHGESVNRLDVLISLTLSFKTDFILLISGSKVFDSLESFLSFFNSSAASLWLTDFKSISLYLKTPDKTISSISSSKIHTSIFFFIYISRRGEFFMAFLSAPVIK